MPELLAGLKMGFSPIAILFNLFGVAVGLAVGVLPGLGPAFGIAVMLPLTYGSPPWVGLSFLLALYCASVYGGSITSILIGVPGTGTNTCTVMDGYPMTRQGKVSRALGISIVCSTIGGIIGVIILIFLAAPLANFALRFGPPEYFAVGLFGLTVVASVSLGSTVKGIIAGLLGVLLSTVGMDPLSGGLRYTFGLPELYLGVPLIPAIMGLFAMSEMLALAEAPKSERPPELSSVRAQLLSLADLWKSRFNIVISSIIGAVIGIIPGAGENIASWTAYGVAKGRSKHPEQFGKGSEEGVAAAESANNACIGGAMVPLLALGVPGSAAAAVFLGALLLQGLTPGPRLFWERRDLIYGMYTSLVLANLFMLGIGLVAVRFVASITRIPKRVLIPLVMILCITGVYVMNNNMFSVWVFLIFGVLGYIFRKLGFPVAPVVLGLVLGPIVDNSLRQTLLMADDLSIFYTRPIVLILYGLSVVSVVATTLAMHRAARAEKEVAAKSQAS